jgi:RNA polymerase sigma-70 factor (ECF subfamily)
MVEEADLPGDDPAPSEPARQAFAAVVAEHWASVYRFLLGSSGHAQDAEDLTQETFLRAWNRLDTFQSGTAMRVWLLRIAANAATDVRRRRLRVAFVPLAHDPPADRPGPGDALDLAEQAGLLRVALEQLSEKTRMVFHLRAQEDLPFREIAEVVGTTEEGARWHMHQARTKLLRQLAERP